MKTSELLKHINKSITESVGDFVYHVTFTSNIKKIQQQGLIPLQTSNWTKQATGDRYNEDGGIFAFTSPEDAIRWAWKQQFEFKKPVSIIKATNSGDWGDDPAENLMMQMKGKALKKHGKIDPSEIVGVVAFDEFAGMMIGTDEGMQKAVNRLT